MNSHLQLVMILSLKNVKSEKKDLTLNLSLSIRIYVNKLWPSIMMMSSNGNIFCVIDHFCGVFGEFPTQRPVTRSFDVFLDQRLNKQLSKQWWGW